MSLLNTVIESFKRIGKAWSKGVGSRRATGYVGLSLESLDGRCMPSSGLSTAGGAVVADLVAIKHDPLADPVAIHHVSVADSVSINHDPVAERVVPEDTGLQRKHDPS